MTEQQKFPTSVFRAISNITRDLAKTGIAKARKNTGQGFNFRGIDDIYNVLADLLVEHGLVIVPQVTRQESHERTTGKGSPIIYSEVTVNYLAVSVEDGAFVMASVVGEAMDSGDKATNKAMSAAYKYLCLQLFCIPTEGDNDADATSHQPTERASKPKPAQAEPWTIEEAEQMAATITSSAGLDLFDRRCKVSGLQGFDLDRARELRAAIAARLKK